MIESHFKCQYTPLTVEWGCEADKRIALLEFEEALSREQFADIEEDCRKLREENQRLREEFRWKKMDEEFPREAMQLEVIYENSSEHRWCEVVTCRKPKGDWLGLQRPVLWRRLCHTTPDAVLQEDKPHE